MKTTATLLAAPVMGLLIATATMPAFASWNGPNTTLQQPIQKVALFEKRPETREHPYKQFGTGRGFFLGALGGYAAGKLAHSRHPVRNSLIGAGVGAYLGHRRHYY